MELWSLAALAAAKNNLLILRSLWNFANKFKCGCHCRKKIPFNRNLIKNRRVFVFVTLRAMKAASWISASAGVLLLASHLLPVPQNGDLAGMPPLCPFKALTNVPCPGCGLTRSLVLFAHGDWAQSVNFHPLGPMVYLALWLTLIAGVLSIYRQPKPISPQLFIFAGSTFAVSLLILWVVRLAGTIPFPAHF